MRPIHSVLLTEMEKSYRKVLSPDEKLQKWDKNPVWRVKK